MTQRRSELVVDGPRVGRSRRGRDGAGNGWGWGKVTYQTLENQNLGLQTCVLSLEPDDLAVDLGDFVKGHI